MTPQTPDQLAQIEAAATAVQAAVAAVLEAARHSTQSPGGAAAYKTALLAEGQALTTMGEVADEGAILWLVSQTRLVPLLENQSKVARAHGAEISEELDRTDEARHRLRRALEQIQQQDAVELALDPEWPRRIAAAALAPVIDPADGKDSEHA